MVFRRILALALCVALLSAGTAALASEREEIVASEYVTIEGSYCVVDSLYGVDAIYSTDTGYFQCWEYVSRFYSTVYGVSIGYDGGSAPLSGSSSCWFQLSETPKAGDIAFASASRRGSYNHWAIVKSYDEETGTITLIEQNYKWNGMAEINRTITYPSSYYEIYTLCSADGAVEPIIDVTSFSQDNASILALISNATTELEIIGEYSDFVLPYARQAAAIGMQIQLSGYTETIDAEAFCGIILDMLNASGYEIRYVDGLPAEELQSSIAQLVAMGIAEASLANVSAITYEQAAVVMQNLVNYLGVTVEYDYAQVSLLADFAQISPSAVDAIAQMMQMEIMKGTACQGVSTFNPKATLSYEQALTIVMRLYNYVPEVIVGTVSVDTVSAELLLPSE